MFQKIKYDSLEFEKYSQLRTIFLSQTFNPKEIKDLDLSKCHAKSLPPFKCLQVLINLTSLNLSKNKINKFDATILTKGTPNLITLNLSDNLIEDLDDIIDLGSLSGLHSLDFSNNPALGYLKRIQVIQMLLYPEKYEKYDPVKILTATYSQAPKPKYSKKQMEQMEEDQKVIAKNHVELTKKDLNFQVSKYDHKNTLIKYAQAEAPLNRKTRFKNLLHLNGRFISKLDILRVSNAKDISEVIDKNPEKESAKGKLKRDNQELHDKYIDNYKKKVMRKLAENEPLLYLGKDMWNPAGTEEDDLRYLSKLDEINNLRRKNKLDPRLLAIEQWEKPLDARIKDTNYSMSIEEYKQMLKEYEENKKKKKEEVEKRKKNYLEKMRGKGSYSDKKKKQSEELKSTGDVNLEEEAEIESDRETRMLFKLKKRIIKPRLNLEMNLENDFGTSESDMPEKENSGEIHPHKYSFLDESDASLKSKKEDGFRKSFLDQSSDEDVSRKQVNQEDEDSQLEIKKKKTVKPAESETHYQESPEAKKEEQQGLAAAKRHIRIKTKPKTVAKKASFSVPNLKEKEVHKREERKVAFEQESPPSKTAAGKNPEQADPNETNAGAKEKEDKPFQPMGAVSKDPILSSPLPVSEFNFKEIKGLVNEANAAPIKNQVIIAEVKENDKNSFNISNKLFYDRTKLLDEERKKQEIRSLMSPKRNNLKESMSLNVLRSKEKEKEEETTSKNYEDYLKRIKERDSSAGEGKTKGHLKHFRKDITLSQKVRVKGNLKENSTHRITIHPDEILPTPDQGLPNGLKFDILNSRGDQYKQIMECKKILENSKNLRQECKDLDSKIEYTTQKQGKIDERQISSFDKVLEFLGGKNKNYSKYIGSNTYLLRDIIYYANDYDKAAEPKLLEPEILEKLKTGYLNEEEWNKLYQQLEILDNINLKKQKLNDFWLKRIEKKEIEQAESNAVLAAHYMKLKKYYNDGKFDDLMKDLQIIDDTEGKGSNFDLKVTPSTGIADPKNIPRTSTIRRRNIATADGVKGGGKKNWFAHIEELKEAKKEVNKFEPVCLEPSPYIAEECNQVLDYLKKRKFKPNPGQKFEDMMEHNLRQIEERLYKKGSGALSLEEKMIKYAQDFKENSKKREQLKMNIEKHITEVRRDLDNFFEWENEEHDKRHDKDYCFKRYVRLVRNGKINWN